MLSEIHPKWQIDKPYLWFNSLIGTSRTNRKGAKVNSKKIVITLRTPKGTEWNLETEQGKLQTVKNNAKKMGYKIVKVGA